MNLLQAEEAARHEESRAAEMAKLARERRVLDKQGKALLKLPNKKERSALDGEVYAGAGIMSKPQMIQSLYWGDIALCT